MQPINQVEQHRLMLHDALLDNAQPAGCCACCTLVRSQARAWCDAHVQAAHASILFSTLDQAARRESSPQRRTAWLRWARACTMPAPACCAAALLSTRMVLRPRKHMARLSSACRWRMGKRPKQSPLRLPRAAPGRLCICQHPQTLTRRAKLRGTYATRSTCILQPILCACRG